MKYHGLERRKIGGDDPCFGGPLDDGETHIVKAFHFLIKHVIVEAEFKEVRLNKTDEELIDKIARCRGREKELIKQMMRHDCWLQKQYADLTGKSVQTINNLMVYGRRRNNESVKALNVSNPFPNFGGTDSSFIIRDELSMGYLLKSLK